MLGVPKTIGQVLLKEAMLVDEELENFEGLGARQCIVAGLEILDQEGQEPGKLLLGRSELLAAAVQFVGKFLEELDVFEAGGKSAHSFQPLVLHLAWRVEQC
jgi:hypothetical protein